MMGHHGLQRQRIPMCQIVKDGGGKERNGPELGENLEREEAEERKP